MSRDRLGDVLPESGTEGSALERSDAPDRVEGSATKAGAAAPVGHQDAAVEFVRFCYRRHSVAWPELYDVMCLVAARGEYRGMSYEQLERLGIGFALPSLPALAAIVARVVAEERGAPHLRAVV